MQGGLFMVVATIVFSGLVTLGYVLETFLYRAMDWQQALTVAQEFSAPGRLLGTFTATLTWVLAWFLSGIPVFGAGFYRSDEWSLVTILMALIRFVWPGYRSVGSVSRLSAKS